MVHDANDIKLSLSHETQISVVLALNIMAQIVPIKK